jgi:hypothetical protein
MKSKKYLLPSIDCQMRRYTYVKLLLRAPNIHAILAEQTCDPRTDELLESQSAQPLLTAEHYTVIRSITLLLGGRKC